MQDSITCMKKHQILLYKLEIPKCPNFNDTPGTWVPALLLEKLCFSLILALFYSRHYCYYLFDFLALASLGWKRS